MKRAINRCSYTTYENMQKHQDELKKMNKIETCEVYVDNSSICLIIPEEWKDWFAGITDVVPKQ